MTVLYFESYRIELERRQLFKDSREIEIEPLVFDLLTYFSLNSGRVIKKQELLSAVWRSVFVSDSVVARAVMKIRRALSDEKETREILTTLHRVGYRFDAEVMRNDLPMRLVKFAHETGDARSIAITPFRNSCVDSSLDWIEDGLMCLAHQMLMANNIFRVASIADVKSVCSSITSDAALSRICSQLNVQEVVSCEVLRSNATSFVLRTRLERANGERVDTEISGDSPVQLLVRLLDQMGVPAEVSIDKPEDEFWLEQLARSMALEQTGLPQRALELLTPCLLHTGRQPALMLMEVRLLNLCGHPKRARQRGDIAMGAIGNNHPAIRLQLLLELAKCAISDDRLDDAKALCEKGITFANSYADLQSEVSVFLALYSVAAMRINQGVLAIQLAEEAVAAASRAGHPIAEARAQIALGHTLIGRDLLDRAADVVGKALSLAGRTSCLPIETRAQMLDCSYLFHRRIFSEALAISRRAGIMAIRCGDAQIRNFAVNYELLGLLELNRLDELQQLLNSIRETQISRNDFQMAVDAVDALLDWRLGLYRSSVVKLERLAVRTEANSHMYHRYIDGELSLVLASLNEVALAKVVLGRMDDDPIAHRVTRSRGALLLAQGKRTDCVDLFRAQWRNGPGHSSNSMDIAVDLAWMLLEDSWLGGSTDEMSELAGYISSFSDEHPPTAFFRAAYSLTGQTGSTTLSEWRTVLQRVPQLLARFPHVARIPDHVSAGGRPPQQLGDLLTRACW